MFTRYVRLTTIEVPCPNPGSVEAKYVWKDSGRLTRLWVYSLDQWSNAPYMTVKIGDQRGWYFATDGTSGGVAVEVGSIWGNAYTNAPQFRYKDARSWVPTAIEVKRGDIWTVTTSFNFVGHGIPSALPVILAEIMPLVAQRDGRGVTA